MTITGDFDDATEETPMSRHTITEQEVDACLEDHWVHIASSVGWGSDKRMEAEPTVGLFRVTDHGSVLYSGRDKAAAIRIYNDAP